MLRGGSPASGVAQAGKEGGGAECELLPSPFYALHRLCPLALRSRAGRLLSLWLFVLRKIQRCRGAGARLWLVAALCVGQNASHNTQILACFPRPVRLSAFPQNVIKRNQAKSEACSLTASSTESATCQYDRYRPLAPRTVQSHDHGHCTCASWVARLRM